MKVKVEPYDVECTHYVIYYSYNNGLTWHIFNVNFLWDKISLCNKNHPLFFKDFDKAVEYAKDLTEEKIKEHKKKMEIEYDEHMEKLSLEIEKRNKRFVS
jgi:hypothetical protein